MKFKKDLDEWEKKLKLVEQRNTQKKSIYENELKAIEEKNQILVEEYEKKLQGWLKKKKEFIEKQNEKNNELIDKMRENYNKRFPEAIIFFNNMILSESEYPEEFPMNFEIDYISETRTIIIDYQLPSIDVIPTVKYYKYNKTQDDIKSFDRAKTEINQLYDDLVYHISLRTIYELYSADSAEAVASIVFNGWVKSLDKGTGNLFNACIVSLQASKEEFLSLNLSNIEPKACFKKLKGVGSAKLHSITPIAPIMQIERKDKRFTTSYDVADRLDDAFNIAAMDWQDFEHLIRELFEKEFTQSGGEVKVTQASRDGGVDAVAFDPDPIRGGKIVIQAKRYTNIVSVASVRDLYGTVVNEGATKGILVTTSEYGPDAYEFAKGKPITLLNGGNLLHLLAKHGHKAKIDLKEAKKIISERDKSES